MVLNFVEEREGYLALTMEEYNVANKPWVHQYKRLQLSSSLAACLEKDE